MHNIDINVCNKIIKRYGNLENITKRKKKNDRKQ